MSGSSPFYLPTSTFIIIYINKYITYNYISGGFRGLCAVCRGVLVLALMADPRLGQMHCSSFGLDRVAGGHRHEFGLVCFLWWMGPPTCLHVQTCPAGQFFWNSCIQTMCQRPPSLLGLVLVVNGRVPSGTCVLKLLWVVTQRCHVLGRSGHLRYGRYGLCI